MHYNPEVHYSIKIQSRQINVENYPVHPPLLAHSMQFLSTLFSNSKHAALKCQQGHPMILEKTALIKEVAMF